VAPVQSWLDPVRGTHAQQALTAERRAGRLRIRGPQGAVFDQLAQLRLWQAGTATSSANEYSSDSVTQTPSLSVATVLLPCKVRARIEVGAGRELFVELRSSSPLVAGTVI